MEILANVLAIIAAPLIALLVGITLQNRRVSYERRYAIFRTLMAERATPVSPASVGVLNLIDVEFRGYPKVLKSYRDYYELVSSKAFTEMDGPTQVDASKRRRADCGTRSFRLCRSSW